MKNEKVIKIANFMKDTEGKLLVDQFIERINSMSFWELITGIDRIEIPIIQRDYAQGRDSEKTNKIRQTFLKSLINAITKDNGSLELDFVYGNIENNVFQPLDGQQRLTTLFLLHWYIAQRIGKLSENKNELLKFTYETRISSREFCNELVNKGDSLGKGKSISEQLKDSTWFFLSWGNDPTIKAMLIMLHDIEKQLEGKDLTELWTKLISKNPPITFYFKELKGIGLTDDLYIKMNARGKALTDFENFKARFEKHIKENGFEKDLSLTEGNKEQWKELTKQIFSHKIDTVWTDLFWKHRGDDNLVDNEFVKFITGIAINSYAENQEIFKSEDEDKTTRKFLEEKKEKNITNEAVKRERIERRITLLFNNPNEIIPEDFPTKISFEYLKSCFDIYSNKEYLYDELKPENIVLWDFLEIKKIKINSEKELDNNLFIDIVKDAKTEYKQRVLFYAQTQFLLQSGNFNSESFTEWMRVVRNLVQNATIDSASAYIGAIGLINELSLGCTDIYQFLSGHSIKSGFASSQVNEEISKAKIITQKQDAKLIIHETEDTNFCKGKIKFPLYCIDYDIKNGNPHDFDTSKLKKVLNVIKNNFSDLKMLLSDEFKSAFLTIQKNDYYNVWGTWSYSFDCNKRWLLNTVDDLKNNFSESMDWKRDYLKDLFKQLFDSKLSEIIKNYETPLNMPEWKKRLIKESDLLEEATFILFPNDNSYCKLAWQQKPSKEEQVKKIE